MCKYCDSWDGYEKAKYQYPKVDDWEDQPYRKPSTHKEKTKKYGGKHPGCYRNDGGAHVYVIIQINMMKAKIRFDREERKWVDNGYEPKSEYVRLCIGCYKVVKRYDRFGYRRTSPVGREFNKSDIYQIIDAGKQPYGYVYLTDLLHEVL